MDLFTPDRARERFHSLNISKSALRSANRNYVLQQIFSFPFFITSFLFFWGGEWGWEEVGKLLFKGMLLKKLQRICAVAVLILLAKGKNIGQGCLGEALPSSTERTDKMVYPLSRLADLSCFLFKCFNIEITCHWITA